MHLTDRWIRLEFILHKPTSKRKTMAENTGVLFLPTGGIAWGRFCATCFPYTSAQFVSDCPKASRFPQLPHFIVLHFSDSAFICWRTNPNCTYLRDSTCMCPNFISLSEQTVTWHVNWNRLSTLQSFLHQLSKRLPWAGNRRIFFHTSLRFFSTEYENKVERRVIRLQVIATGSYPKTLQE